MSYKIADFFFGMPVLAINLLFDRKSFKHILINSGYWVVRLPLMGEIVRQ
jgi:hypothetical protein